MHLGLSEAHCERGLGRALLARGPRVSSEPPGRLPTNLVGAVRLTQVSVDSADDALLLARALPSGCAWVAHVDGAAAAAPLGGDEAARLKEAGCAGLAVAAPECLRPAVLEEWAR